LLILLVLLAGCTGVPDGVQPVTGFELERYLGTWYEIARLDHRFERGLSRVSAEYSRREDGGIRVVNRGFNTADGRWEQAEGKAYFVEGPHLGRLKVSFFGPFYGGYNIFALDRQDYSYAMISGPDKSYLWILARRPELDADTFERLVERARGLGFPVETLIRVSHAEPGPALRGRIPAGPN
jgi:apolipoprotein D and lipocalin family protein